MTVEVNKSRADNQPLGVNGVIVGLGWGYFPLAPPLYDHHV